MRNCLCRFLRLSGAVFSAVLLLATGTMLSAYNPHGDSPVKALLPTRPPVVKSREVVKPVKLRLSGAPLRKMVNDSGSFKGVAMSGGNDPIRFTMTTPRRLVGANEPIEIVIKAELLDIPSSLLFFTDEATAFRLKVLLPAGFIATGGTYQDMIGDKLALPARPVATYTLQGYFETINPSMCFRLLRAGGQADNGVLFVEKAALCLQGGGTQAARIAVLSAAPPVIAPLNATAGDCAGITLSARADLTSVNAGGQATLSVSCAGCETGSSFNSGNALVFDGIDDQVETGGVYAGISSSFTWEAWVKPTQPLTGNKYNERYALFPAHGGNGGTITGMGVAVGTTGIQVYESTDDYLNTQLVHNQSISGWTHIAVVYTNNTPALYINGQFIKSGTASGKKPKPSMNLGGGDFGHFQGSIDEARMWNVSRTQAQIVAAYQQIISTNEPGLVAYWRFEETGNTTTNSVIGSPLPTSGTFENGTSRGAGVSINSGGTGTTYSWQALQGGSSITNPSAASTPVIVPSVAGSYTYQVTLTSGSCSTTQDVAVTVTSPNAGGIVSGNCYTIQNQQSQGYAQRQSDNSVSMVPRNTTDNNQLWQAGAVGNQFRFTSKGSGADQVLYVDNTNCGSDIKVGSYSNDNTHNWTLEQNAGSVYRVQTQGKSWDQRSFGTDPVLQMCGDNSTGDGSYNQPYRLFAFVAASCPGGVGPNLAVNPTALSQQPASGSSQVITVTSTISWSAGSTDSWITVNPASGTTDGAFTLTVQANNGGAARSGSVNVTGGGVTRSIAVNQLAAASDGRLVSGNCYVIKSLQTATANNTLQPTAENTVRHQVANGQDNQIWKAESVNNQYRFTVQSGNRDQALYVAGFGDGQLLRVGSYVNDERYQWSLVASSAGGYRVYGGSTQNTWDQASAGLGPELQLYGSETSQNDGPWNQSFRRFGFTQTTCPTSGCAAPTLSLGTPVCNGTAGYSVPFTVQPGNASLITTGGTVSGNQIINIPLNTTITVTALLSSCQSQATVSAPTCSGSGDPFVNHQVSSRRWIGLAAYLPNQNSNGGIIPEDAELIAHSASLGCNYVYATINWFIVQPTSLTAPNKYRWEQVDDLLATAAANNLKVFFRIGATRTEDNNTSSSGEKFIPDAEQMKDQSGNLLLKSGEIVASHYSTLMASRLDGLATDIINHIKFSAYANLVMGFSMATSTGYESEYTTRNRVNGQAEEVNAVYDYSDRSLTKFRDRMRLKYHDNIGDARRAWNNTTYTSFDDIILPQPERETDGTVKYGYSFPNTFTNDFWNHKQLGIVETARRFHLLVKAISPNLYTLTEFGSVYDNLSQGRGTMSITNLIETDGIKQNDGPESDIRLSTALSLRNYSANQFAGNEINCNRNKYSNQSQTDQITTFFQRGGSLMDLFGYYYTGDPRNNPTVVQEAKANLTAILKPALITTPLSVPVVNSFGATLTIKASDLANKTWQNGNPQNIIKFREATEGDTKRVRVVIENDL